MVNTVFLVVTVNKCSKKYMYPANIQAVQAVKPILFGGTLSLKITVTFFRWEKKEKERELNHKKYIYPFHKRVFFCSLLARLKMRFRLFIMSFSDLFFFT